VQLQKLKALVRYADAQIPYYHRRFKTAGFTPNDLHTVEDLQRIPVTRRTTINRHHRDFLPEHVSADAVGHWWEGKDYTQRYTSGTSGQPLEVIYDWHGRNYSSALLQYAFAECGVRLRDTLAITLSRGTVQSDPAYLQTPPWIRRQVNTLLHRFNTVFVPVIDPFAETVQRLRHLAPDVLYAQTGVLEDLCAHDTAGIAPRLIFTHAATLTASLRGKLRATFNVDPFNTYGSVEFNRLAFECPAHAGLHVITDGAVVECLDDAGDPVAPGEPGETVVTGLYNRAMPLIRYELGDLAVPLDDPCPCGRGWPLLREIQGKKNDRFILPSGRVMGGHYLAVMKIELKQHPWCLAHFQLVQEAKDRIVFKVVKGPEFEHGILDRILDHLGNELAAEHVQLDYEIVKAIPLEPTGKRKFLVSHV
jgi:phenylacetate-CoA ligase